MGSTWFRDHVAVHPRAGYREPGSTITGGSVPACSQVPYFQATVTAVTINIFAYFIEPATDHATAWAALCPLYFRSTLEAPAGMKKAAPGRGWVLWGARRGQPSTRLGLDSHTVARTSRGVKASKEKAAPFPRGGHAARPAEQT